MKELLYLLIFFFCLASAAGSILLSQKLKAINPVNTFDSLFYFVILSTFFGIYSIWGQVIIYRVLLYLSASPDIVNAIGHIIPLLGFPFLIMGGYLLIRFGHELWGGKISLVDSMAFYLFYFILLVVFGWISFYGFREGQLNFKNPLTILILFFALQEIVIHFWYLLIHSRRIRKNRYLTYLSFTGRYLMIFFTFLIIKLGAILLLFIHLTWAPVFILIYFFALIGPVFYLYRHQRQILIEVQPDIKIVDSQESILKRNGVTRREREIIDLICTGKTNQEIADSLFISLQTVKDHTHRIYLKVEVKNRMQLIHLLRK
jgi:DNA-binding CsgD family transcriptional regulator